MSFDGQMPYLVPAEPDKIMILLQNKYIDYISARIVPNEVGGSGCNYPEICMVGVLGCGAQMMFVWRNGVSSRGGGSNPRYPQQFEHWINIDKTLKNYSNWNIWNILITADVALDNGHPVGGQGTGLVGAYCCSISHRFAGVQVPDEIVIMHHFLRKIKVPKLIYDITAFVH